MHRLREIWAATRPMVGFALLVAKEMAKMPLMLIAWVSLMGSTYFIAQMAIFGRKDHFALLSWPTLVWFAGGYALTVFTVSRVASWVRRQAARCP